MKKEEIIKAWKDPDYRNRLGEEVTQIPEHPAGWTNLDDSQLKDILGGAEEVGLAGTEGLGTFGCCTYWIICDGVNTAAYKTLGCCPGTNAGVTGTAN